MRVDMMVDFGECFLPLAHPKRQGSQYGFAILRLTKIINRQAFMALGQKDRSIFIFLLDFESFVYIFLTFPSITNLCLIEMEFFMEQIFSRKF